MEKDYETSAIEVTELGAASVETLGVGIVQADLPAGQPNTGILDE